MALTVMEEHHKREVDPTLTVLRSALLEEPSNTKDEYAQTRIKELHDLLEQATTWSNEFQNMSSENLERLVKLGTGVGKVLDIKDKILKK